MDAYKLQIDLLRELKKAPDGTNVYLDAKPASYFSGDVKYYKPKKPGMIKCVENEEVVALIGEFIFKGDKK